MFNIKYLLVFLLVWNRFSKKCCLREWVIALWLKEGVMIRTWQRILLLRVWVKMSRFNLFHSYMHFPVILIPETWTFPPTVMIGYTGFRENSTKFLERDKVLRDLQKYKILISRFRYSLEKRRQPNKKGLALILK